MRVRQVMTTTLSTLLGAALSVGLVVSAPSPASADPDAVREAQKKVNALHEQASAIDLKHSQLEQKLAEATSRAHRLGQDVEAQRTTVAALRTDMGRLAVAQFQQGGLGMTTQLMTSRDEGTMLNRMVTIQSATDRTNAQVRTLQAEQAKLSTMELQVKQERAQIQADTDKQAELAREYQQKVDEAEKTLNRLTAEEKARLKRLQEEEAARQLAARRAADARRAAEAARQAEQNRTSADQTPEQSPAATPSPTRSTDTPSADPQSTPTQQQPPAASSGAAAAVAYARAQVGKPYIMGATGPDAFDCSGLTSAAWSRAGVGIPRTSQEQASAGVEVSLANIQPGDLVIFYPGATHVGIYVGGGMLVDAANPRVGVREISLSNSWMPIHSIRRVG